MDSLALTSTGHWLRGKLGCGVWSLARSDKINEFPGTFCLRIWHKSEIIHIGTLEHISEENFKEGFVLLNAYLTTYQSKILSDTFAEYNGKIEYNEHDRWQIHRWEDAPSVTSSLLSVYSECQLPLGPVIWDLCIMTLYSMPPDCYFVQIGIFWLKIRPINCVYVRRFLNYCS